MKILARFLPVFIAMLVCASVFAQTSITPMSHAVGAETVSYQILVTASAAWTATKDAGWVTLSRTSGSLDSNILVTASANTTGADRTATIQVDVATHTLTQKAASAAIQELWAFGADANGQLGDNVLLQRQRPSQVAASVQTVAAGWYHSLILKTDGSLWATGYNGNGQLGDGTATSRTSPVQIFSGGVHAAAAGWYHSLILKTDGSLWATGDNSAGQLGDGTTTNRASPVQVLSAGVQAAAAGAFHSLILKTDGSLWVVGYNSYGQLGDGTTTSRTSPVRILSGGVQAVAAGLFHSLILKTDGSLWAMGYNGNGQLGDGTTTSRTSPVQILSGGVQAVAADGNHSLILKTNGSLWAIGDNSDGQLGDGTTTSRTSPVQILSGGVQAITAGLFHSFFIKTDGSLWAMGDNSYGQLGDGTTTSRLSPVQVLSAGVQAVAAGANHSLILKTDGSLWVVGYNFYGQLGDGTTTSRLSPVQVLSAGVQAVAAGANHSLVIKTDGSLWAMGDNSASQLGDGTTTNRASPVQVLSAGVQAAAAGAFHSLILKTDGTLWVMGDNSDGQLGDGTTTARNTPELIAVNVQKIAAGEYNSLAVAIGNIGSGAPAFTVEPVNEATAAGGTVIFSVTTTGTPAPTYQWQVSVDGGTIWSDLTNSSPYSGVTTETLSITGATLSMNGYLYRCVETNSVGIATSSSALLKVTLPLRDSADFNGDGMTDILWQNNATGQRALWLMNGIQNGFQPSSIVNLGWVDTNWSIAGTGDFNRDGQTDILWQNTATGQRAIWLMNGIQNGFQPTAIVDLGWVDLNWSIAGTGDFNGDGMTDILWQNITTGQRALWLMNGIQNGFHPTAIVNLGWVDLNWSIAGTGDFNGDGMTDILWQNITTGQRALWLMNGIQNGFQPTAIVDLGWVDLNWLIVGAGDFNGDGMTDILWQKTTDGQRALWLMNGIQNGFHPAAIVNLGWVDINWSMKD